MTRDMVVLSMHGHTVDSIIEILKVCEAGGVIFFVISIIPCVYTSPRNSLPCFFVYLFAVHFV